MSKHSRYLSGHKGLSTRRPPQRLLLWGPEALSLELVRSATRTLAPTEVLSFRGEEPEGVLALTQRPPQRRVRLVTWWEFPAPYPDLADAVRNLRPVRGTWLVACSPSEPDSLWPELFDLTISPSLSPRQRIELIQRTLGGATSAAAVGILERCAHDPAAALGEVAKLRLLSDAPTSGDVAELLPRSPDRDFISALIACDRPRARRAAPAVERPGFAVGALEYRLAALWSLVESRPPVHRSTAREVSERLAMARPLTDELLPLVRLYSRAKIRARLEALAVVDAELRHGARRGLLEVLVALW